MTSSKYSFVSEPEDDLVCLICLEVAKEPWQHGKCGRLLCDECLDKHGRYKPCPNCRETQPQYFEDNRSKRAIQALPVKCGSVERGCEWVGTVATLEEHVATCEFTLLPCPKQCKDDNSEVKSFMRKDLDKHLMEICPNRDHTCEICGEKGAYAHMTQAHDKTCAMKILPCPNAGCTDTMQRQHIENHVATVCEYTMTPCKFRRLGCETKLKRRDMAAHEEDYDKLHLHMAMNTTAKLERELQDKEKVFKITEYQRRKDECIPYQSPSFYTSPEGYHMNIRVHVSGTSSGEGTHVSVFAYFLKGDNDDKLNWPFVGVVTLTLLNQLEDRNHFSKALDITLEKNIRPFSNRGYATFIPHSNLGYDLGRTQYLKDDTLYFRVSVKVANHRLWLECTLKT